MFDPEHLEVNEAWIAFKLNDAPIRTEADGDFNVIALMDAASGFILGNEFVSIESTELSQDEASRLFENALSHKQQLPKSLLIPENLAATNLQSIARQTGISAKLVPEDELPGFISEAREGFKQHVCSGSVQ